MFNYFVFDGHDSRDYGVYISGGGTFNSPAREYDNISVPGRDGDLLGINTRLQNVTLTYPAGIVSDFSNNIAGLRNMLLSTVGYAVLRDSYHPDEYRYAVYKGGLTPDPLSDLSAAEFNITFECKPQRYLDSGGEVRDVDAWGDTDTETGDIVTFTGEPNTGIKDLSVAITPVQAGTGDPSPSNVRAISGWTGVNVNVAGANLLPHPDADISVLNGITMSVDNDGVVTLNGTTTAVSYVRGALEFPLAIGNYTFAFFNSVAYNSGVEVSLRVSDMASSAGGWHRLDAVNQTKIFTSTAAAYYWQIQIANGVTFNNFKVKPMLVLGSTAPASYVPFVGADTTAISWQSTAGTVYGGTLDVTTGVLTVTHEFSDFGSLSWTWDSTRSLHKSNDLTSVMWYSNTQAQNTPYIAEKFTITTTSNLLSMTTGQFLVGTSGTLWVKTGDQNTTPTGKMVYPLATPATYTLTPEQVATLLGVNNIWADCGNITVEYGDDPGKLLNPTLMPARPLIRVYGYGTLVIGNVTVTISNYGVSYIDIDCAMMDCYNGATNLNSYVTFSGNDFPTLGPGATGVSYSGSITKVLITTNWWRV